MRESIHTAVCEVKQILNVKIDPATTKHGNKAIACLTQMTLIGEKTWDKQADGSYVTELGAWDMSILDGTLTITCRRNEVDWAVHQLAATKTGRLLNLLVNIPEALAADQALRKQFFAQMVTD